MSELLKARVSVARRFTRSIRIDADLNSEAALEGFICTPSAVEALLLMARHWATTAQGAFTWTGPYGSGKSSLAVALGAVMAGEPSQAAKLLSGASSEDLNEILHAFRPNSLPWSIVPIVGRRADPQEALEQALRKSIPRLPKRRDGEQLANWVLRISQRPGSQGLVLLIDEMGKFLESAALENGDIHIFQDMAEVASRSGGRLLVVGVLHQAFDEYAHRLSRQARDEWMKVQGRYVDLAISLADEEQIELIARAIQSEGRPKGISEAAKVVAGALRNGRSVQSTTVAERLAACWPLHPVTAAMLGPLSRRRFGQSQRSIFGFLTSAEPSGFQEYLATVTNENDLFGPDRLWDYLRTNLEQAILASPDGHRWSTAVDAVQRTEDRGGSQAHVRFIKSIALLDLFKGQVGSPAQR